MNTLHAQDFDALLVDLDGVITKTAIVHASAWKRLFDEFLKRRAASTNEPFEPFDIEGDYRKFVDGLPRYKGVETFLQSREFLSRMVLPGTIRNRKRFAGWATGRIGIFKNIFMLKGWNGMNRR